MIHTRKTSAWANRARSPGRSRRYRNSIVACLRLHGSLTRETLGTLLLIPGDSLRPRVRELLRAGAIRVVVGTYGKTKAGNKAELLAAKRLSV